MLSGLGSWGAGVAPFAIYVTVVNAHTDTGRVAMKHFARLLRKYARDQTVALRGLGSRKKDGSSRFSLFGTS